MKQIKTRLLSLALVLGILCSLCPSVLALHQGDAHWWTDVGSDQSYKLDVDENGQVHSDGAYVLFTSDVHRYAYLAKDLLETANAAIAGEGGKVGLMSFGGDFANEYVLYEDNMRILKAALGDTPATYTKGNHEGNMSDTEFESFTGMSRIGETAVNDSGLYHFFNFGAESNSQAFSDADIAKLTEKLASWKEDGKPIIIVSHFPLHYYNDRRSTKQADKVVSLLNEYPQTIFLWGHNHTEQDPNYGMIRTPGDLIQTGADAGTSQEINFTYACLGALRDGTNGANGLLARFNDDGTTTFRYLQLNAAAGDETWTDAQGNENAVRYTSNEGVSSETTVATPGNYAVIDRLGLLIQRPLVGNAPVAKASAFSSRFTAGAITWTANGAPVSGAFDFSTTYSATVTLTAADGCTFGSDPTVSVNKQYQGPMPGVEGYAAEVTRTSGTEITATYTFAPTVDKLDTPIAPATQLQDGVVYTMAAIDGNMAASYVYNPADHGEESRPEYTVSPADVVVQDGNLVSAAPGGASFAAQQDGKGFMLWSDYSLNDGKGATTLNYLSLASKGPEQTLQAGETLDQAIYADWYLDDAGQPYLNIDGAVRYVTFDKGAFGFSGSAEACNVRLYPVSSTATVYNVAMDVPTPKAGAQAPADTRTDYGAYTLSNITWSPSEVFTYDTAYTVTADVTLKDGFAFGALCGLTGRVAGSTAKVEKTGDSTAKLTYTFDKTAGAPGLESGLRAVKASGLKDGGTYVIVSGGNAMSAAPEGLYRGSSKVTAEGDTLVGGLRAELFFTANGNDKDGYTLSQNGAYLGAHSTEPGSPDVWGFENKDKASAAITWSYANSILTAESTGSSGGPGGPPPGGPEQDPNTLYLNDGHFNFSTFKASEIKLYEVVNPFTDITAEDWSYPYIYRGAYHGITKGAEPDQFNPSGKLTRAMAITMIYRVAGCPEAICALPFTDVEDDYYTDALRWAVSHNIVNGYGDGTFRPNQNVTREEAFKMAGLAFGELPDAGKGKTYADAAKISDFAKAPIENLTKAGVLEGDEDLNTIRPQDEISREEAIKTFMVIFDLTK